MSAKAACVPHSVRRNLLVRNRWLLARRLVQGTILVLFLLGPWFAIWWVKGNLASSTVLDVLSLTDPLILLQSLAAGHAPHALALTGALIVLVFYLVVGGRVYCSWVCPINVVTDAAHWLRTRLGLGPGWQPRRSLRYWLLAMTLIVSAVTGSIAWELVNPITWLHRGLVFGMGLAWLVVLAVFLFDLLVSRRGWCSHLCPVGAFYGALGCAALVRVNARGRAACTDCGDCYRACPEPQVLVPALKPRAADASVVIASGDCTNCGRCIDVCGENVLHMGTRFAKPP
ncbi:MAG: quinol dehydrogenase ferredoxin subunit NapH [Burkholderiales bacterium]|nr:quinol dehydrogenase ferredoxin subunit NapH [Burkholderiales bacterium]